MRAMDLSSKTSFIIEALEKKYPDIKCGLTYGEPWQLLVAVRLSAQCTDKRVNIVTEELFNRYPTLSSLADADYDELCEIVKPCGLFRVKARDIIECSRRLRDEYDSVLPDEIDALVALPGVGRKTANLIVGDVYGKPSYVCDTHCIRISKRLGLTASTDPVSCEKELRKIIPPESSGDFCHRLVEFGRDVCKAKKPDCANCILRDACDSAL